MQIYFRLNAFRSESREAVNARKCFAAIEDRIAELNDVLFELQERENEEQEKVE